jgi:DNA-binding SARP family transcriptional activator
MSALHICLFGRFDVRCGEQALTDFNARRMQELFCYLLLHRDRPHPRETLASLLWCDCSTAQSKKRLRQALWQLQATLETCVKCINDQILLAEFDWIQINPDLDLWLDVAVFEQAYAFAREVPGKKLDTQRMEKLQAAVDLYRGDLLEGWYQDWCLYERERLQNMYLSMLDKLMGYCEAHGCYETGLAYGNRLLHYDPAHERTHQRMMHLYYLVGDRTAALRQYERCVNALDEELCVKPTEHTVALYERIRACQPGKPTPISAKPYETIEETATTLFEALNHFKQIQLTLVSIQSQVQQGIQVVESAMNSQI